jgi:membrane protein DedA with SNARE-associated domain
VTDAAIRSSNSFGRSRWASLAFWLLFVVWAVLFGLLGYAVREPAAVSEMLGIRTNDIVGVLLLAAAVVGLLAYGVRRSR